MLIALLAHLTLLTLAVWRRDGGQGVAALLLLGNWALCSAFVYFSGVDFPWIWYLTIDWLTAITLWIDRDTIWQRLLIASYGVEMLMHGAFAWVTRNVDPLLWSRTDAWLYWTQMHYHDGLSAVAWLQIILVGTWIGYDAARAWGRGGWRLPSFLARYRKAAS